ncbi:MAG: peptidoglycan DD-metalloendopeptidase family protein [Clostridiales bacterium]|nr:peptidoglycan DD-metalloendopeptidase family protein [Clostridiales bacterium]
MKKHSFTQKLTNFLNGRGFYIALALCLVAIGVSCWYLWQGATLAREMAEEASAVETVTLEPEESEETAGDADISTDPADTEEPTEEDAPRDAPAGSETEDTETAEVAETATVTEEAAETLEPVTETAAEVSEWVWPLEGAVVAAFSSDTLTYNEALGDWRTHSGIDLSAEVGQEVVAAYGGTVISIQDDVLLGRTVTVDCGSGLTTLYGNLAEDVAVTAGDIVSAGDTIGAVGETASGERNETAWLHFAVEQDGEPVDPMEYLG